MSGGNGKKVRISNFLFGYLALYCGNIYKTNGGSKGVT